MVVGAIKTYFLSGTKMAENEINEKTAKLKKLEEELWSLDSALANLMKEKTYLQQKCGGKSDHNLSSSTEKHYRYILPLVKEVFLLELKLKEQKRIYDCKKWKCEAERQGHDLLTETLNEENCVLKQWFSELSCYSSPKEDTVVTNRDYKVRLYDDCLKELLKFTVVSQGVQVSLQINAKTLCERILFLHPVSTNVGFRSDTYVPDLEEKVKISLSQGSPIKDIVHIVAQYIREEMAPYVITVSPKKKKSKLKLSNSKAKPESADSKD